jgi:hypothetical protein
MSDTQAWYQRKLAQMRGQQPKPYPQRYQPPQPTPRYQAPQPPQWQPQQQQPQQPVPQQIPVTIDNLYEMAGHWRGGPGARNNPQPCPQCGGNQYFENITSGKRGPQPAPHCYDCGYNGGMFQQGMESSWVS